MWVRGLKQLPFSTPRNLLKSHPMWVRGLKHHQIRVQTCGFQVAPYVGAWIETQGRCIEYERSFVAPYVGAWIETPPRCNISITASVAPYVGAWIETAVRLKTINNAAVAPYVGAWIETKENISGGTSERSHPMWVRGLKHY